MSKTKFGLVFLCVVGAVNVQATQAEDQKGRRFDWLDSEQSEIRNIAQSFIARVELPTEATSVWRKIDIKLTDSEVITRVRKIDYFPTFNEAHASGNHTIYWDPLIEELDIREAATLTRDGQWTRVNPESVRVQETNTYNTFVDNKEIVLPFSGLTGESVTLVEYETRAQFNEMEMDWSEVIFPAISEPVERFELNVSFGSSTQIRWSNTAPNVECEETTRELRCTGESLEPYPDDVGVIWRDVIGQVAISRAHDWDVVINETLSAFELADYTDPMVVEQTAKLTQGLETQEEKVYAIHQFVSRDIRYISLSELGHRITPHRAVDVLTNRYGDCKDKSALLVGMLESIGLQPFPVLVATDRSDLEQMAVPSGGYFDHMIVCFELAGDFYCIDATDADTHWGSVSAWIHNRVILELAPGNTPVVLVGGLEDSTKWNIDVETEFIFDGQGGQRETQKRTFFGTYAGTMRYSIRGLSPEETSEALVDGYQSTVSNLATPAFNVMGLDEMSDVLVIESEAEYEPFLDSTQSLNYTENDAWVKMELGDMKTSTEHFPARIEGLTMTSTSTFDLTEIWSLTRLPSDLSLKGEFGEMTREVEYQSDGTINVVTRVAIPRQTLEVSSIESYNNFIDLLIRESSISMSGRVKS